MVAIHTKFLGPTNHREARYKAIAGEGGKGFELTLNSEQNHYRVARELIRSLEWFHEQRTIYRWYVRVDGIWRVSWAPSAAAAKARRRADRVLPAPHLIP